MDYYIYKIYSSDPFVKHLYIGSTNDFERRVRDHKNCSSFTNISIDNIKKLYSIIRAYGGWEHWKMEIIETIPCTDRQAAEEREQYYYETLNASLNSEPPIKDKTKERFKCDTCSFIAYKEENLKKHKENCWCSDEFKIIHPTLMLEDYIKAQQKEILKLKQPTCKICHEPFTYQWELEQHSKSCVHQSYSCKYCNKTLSSKRSLERHQQTCKGVHSLQCPTCKKTFTTREGKYKHMKKSNCQLVLTEEQQRIKDLQDQLEERNKEIEVLKQQLEEKNRETM